MFFKNKKGVTTIDVAISLVIIMLFVSIFATLIFSVYISNQSVKRNTIATTYMTDIFEKINTLEYDDTRLLAGNYYEDDENKILDITIADGYSANLKITDYNKIEGNENKEDLIKIIELDINYKVGQSDKKLTAKTLKINDK